jgi:predicted nucleic acid-binding protein
MSANIFVDTNVFVYSRDAAKPEKQARAAEWMAYLWETGAGRLSLQVLAEFYAVVTRKLKPGLDSASARQDVEDLFAWQPAPLTPDLIVEAWTLQDLFQLSWWDALIIAAAKLQGCTAVLSEDFQHGQDFQGVRVMDPFRVSPAEF